MEREKLRLAVLFGGCSSEYGVSLHSAAAVIDNLHAAGYRPLLLGIDREGRWYRYLGQPARIADGSWLTEGECRPAMIAPDRAVRGVVEFGGDVPAVHRLDAALPLLHGKNGEDGTVQGLLELAGIPCAGCGCLASALAMDKDMAHRLAALAGVAAPRGSVLREPQPAARLRQLAAEIGYPLFVKPARAGSSLGISRITEEAMLAEAVAAAFTHDNKVILEEAVAGFEVGCAVLGDYDRAPLVAGPDEIELEETCAGFFDYGEKYSLLHSRIVLPARLSAEAAQRVRDAALTVYQALECRGMARVDLFYTPQGAVVFNEVNTIPGFTAASRFPQMLLAAGLRFSDILDRLIRDALARGANGDAA